MLFSNWKDAPWDTKRWPNFSRVELSCKCGDRFCSGEYYHDPEFLDALQAVRTVAGKSVIVNSAHRCAQWNAAVGGAPMSMHKRIAVDISLRNHDRHELLEQCKAAGFNGLGMAISFLHIDKRARSASWYYGSRSRELWQT